MSEPVQSILDSAAISGCYLFPQPRRVSEPFVVEVPGVELACYKKVVDPDGLMVVHFHGNGEAVADYVPEMVEELSKLGLNSLFVEYRQYGSHNSIMAFNHDEYFKGVAFLARAAGSDC